MTKFKENITFQISCVALVTLLAAVLRLYKLGEWSFWIDELITVNNVQSATIMKSSSLLTSLVVNLFGLSEWSARFSSAIIGTISIPILYFPVRRLFGPVVALLASLLLAISPWHIYMSQNARYYTTLLLFYSLALLIFYIGLEEKRLKYIFLSLLLLIVAILERAFALFFVPVVISYLVLLKLLNYETSIEKWLSKKVIVAVTLSPIIAFLFYDVLSAIFTENASLIYSFYDKFVNNSEIHSLGLVTRFIGTEIGAPLFCVATAGFIFSFLKRDQKALFFSVSAIVPIAILIVLSPFVRTATRYALVALYCWTILGAIGVKALYQEARKGKGYATVIVGVVMVLLMGQTPIIEDVLYYIGQALDIEYPVQPEGLLFGTVILSTTLIVLLAGFSRLGMANQKKAGIVWAFIILLSLIVHSSVTSALYYAYQHGHRDNVKAALDTIEKSETGNKTVYMHRTLTGLGSYYLNNYQIKRVDDIASAKDLVSDDDVWIVEEFGLSQTQLGGVAFADWAETNCDTVATLDTYTAGRTWPMRTHLCHLKTIDKVTSN